MANGTTSPQSGGILDTITSGVKGLTGFIGDVAPYALPIGLGAVMGHGLPGGALGGGAAGLAMAEGASGERQRQEQEIEMKRQQIALEAQEADINIQKGKNALRDDAQRQAFRKTITDPTEQALYDSSPEKWADYRVGKGSISAITSDPEFSKHHPDLDAKELSNMPPDAALKILEANATKKDTYGAPVSPDGGKTWLQNVYHGDGTITTRPAAGAPASVVAANIREKGEDTRAGKDRSAAAAEKAEQALRLRAAQMLETRYGKFRAENDKAQAKNDAKIWGDPDPLPHPEIAKYATADDYREALLDSTVESLRPKKDPNALLKSAGKGPVAPVVPEGTVVRSKSNPKDMKIYKGGKWVPYSG